MSELTKLGSQFDKAQRGKKLRPKNEYLYEDMGNILSRYYKIGEITEDEMRQRLGIAESKGDCGCGCGGVTEGGCGGTIKEEAVKVSTETLMVRLLLQLKKNQKNYYSLKDKLSDEGG